MFKHCKHKCLNTVDISVRPQARVLSFERRSSTPSVSLFLFREKRFYASTIPPQCMEVISNPKKKKRIPDLEKKGQAHMI